MPAIVWLLNDDVIGLNTREGTSSTQREETKRLDLVWSFVTEGISQKGGDQTPVLFSSALPWLCHTLSVMMTKAAGYGPTSQTGS